MIEEKTTTDIVLDLMCEEVIDDNFSKSDWEPKSYGDSEWIERVVNFFAK